MSDSPLYNMDKDYTTTDAIRYLEICTLLFIGIFTVYIPIILIDYYISHIKNVRMKEYINEKKRKRLTVTDYSEKLFVIRGNAKIHKDKLKELGGRWNDRLKDGPGWIFSNNKRTNVDNWLSR